MASYPMFTSTAAGNSYLQHVHSFLTTGYIDFRPYAYSKYGQKPRISIDTVCLVCCRLRRAEMWKTSGVYIWQSQDASGCATPEAGQLPTRRQLGTSWTFYSSSPHTEEVWQSQIGQSMYMGRNPRAGNGGSPLQQPNSKWLASCRCCCKSFNVTLFVEQTGQNKECKYFVFNCMAYIQAVFLRARFMHTRSKLIKQYRLQISSF